ncbi:MAG: histidinol-phosphate transaminase [Ruminococcaceae bacterium]|nr:histidinol-phosphate transaminase [Oscillospiraceae bacterium]
MSRFFSSKYKNLTPYTPGEQPKDTQYIKLNTNESPYPPSEKAIKYASEASEKLNLYPDPTCSALHEAFAKTVGVETDMVLATNGSDEILNFAFMAFCNENCGAVFPDITYGFYSVFAQLNNIPYEEIPLKDDFTIDVNDYIGKNKTIFIANPNAPTGIPLSLSQIEEILKGNPDNIVVIDEAYIDFGNDSAVSLIPKYDNLLVTQTFSKSRSMAGARLGFGIASKEIINDLNTVKYSTNPYNINKMTIAAGIGILEDNDYTLNNCEEIIKTREYTADALSSLGFTLTPSTANFLFAKHNKISGKEIYSELKENGILVRHFDKEKIKEYNRITIGTKEQMETLVSTLKSILEDR